MRLSFIDGVRLGGTCFVTRVNKYIYNDVVVMDLVDCNICYCRVLPTMAPLSGQVINSMTTNAKAVVPPAGSTAAALKSQNLVL